MPDYEFCVWNFWINCEQVPCIWSKSFLLQTICSPIILSNHSYQIQAMDDNNTPTTAPNEIPIIQKPLASRVAGSVHQRSKFKQKFKLEHAQSQVIARRLDIGSQESELQSNNFSTANKNRGERCRDSSKWSRSHGCRRRNFKNKMKNKKIFSFYPSTSALFLPAWKATTEQLLAEILPIRPWKLEEILQEESVIWCNVCNNDRNWAQFSVSEEQQASHSQSIQRLLPNLRFPKKLLCLAQLSQSNSCSTKFPSVVPVFAPLCALEFTEELQSLKETFFFLSF